MNEPFMIPVIFQGTEHEFKARFERWGYTHRIAVLVDDTTFVFEPDEEGAYRVLTQKDEQLSPGAINVDLLKAVADKIASLNTF